MARTFLIGADALVGLGHFKKIQEKKRKISVSSALGNKSVRECCVPGTRKLERKHFFSLPYFSFITFTKINKNKIFSRCSNLLVAD